MIVLTATLTIQVGAFSVAPFFGNGIGDSGDTWSTNIYDFWAPTNDCWADLFANQTECIELAVWQINLSQTAERADGGWAACPNSGRSNSKLSQILVGLMIELLCARLYFQGVPTLQR